MSNDFLADENGSQNTVELSLYEVRRKIYPRSVSGVFAKWRLILVLATQILFYGLPWVQWNDRQAVLFDLVSRKFYIFGLVLWPQDIIYLTLLLILSALALFLFTAVAGRLFCGYACPQTVYTEIFMWIERKIEGDRSARIRLDDADFSVKKLSKKVYKHTAWIVLSLWTGFTFVGYFTPIHSLAGAVIAFGVGMALFTMIMGNAFAAFPVMIAAIGMPLLIKQYDGDPAIICAIGMLAGFCGTLMTPMAANFNLVPAALLELKDENAVVKTQIATAVPLLIVNIALIYFLAFR